MLLERSTVGEMLTASGWTSSIHYSVLIVNTATDSNWELYSTLFIFPMPVQAMVQCETQQLSMHAVYHIKMLV